VKYPSVYRSHIVPKGYLREFAVNEKIVAVNREGIEESKPIEKAGTRARHYRRERPGSGEPIDDIEWSLSNLENVAIPALRTLKDTWPPDAEQKNRVATLFASSSSGVPAGVASETTTRWSSSKSSDEPAA
jgi:hypothetical protein